MTNTANHEFPENHQEEPYPGERLGLPQTGRGSLATLGYRFLALGIDWLACMLISAAFFNSNAWANLAIFTVSQTVLVTTGGASLGHRIVGMRVVPLHGGGRVSFVSAMIRALLISVVLPAVVWDADGRGVHDRIAKTVLLRTR